MALPRRNAQAARGHANVSQVELEPGGSLSTRATKEDVFADYETIWKTVTQRIGLEIMAPDVDQEHVPPDPSLN